MPKKVKNERTYETAYARLEEIVVAIENGEAAIGEAMEMYKEGVELIGYCTETLDKTEQVLLELRKKAEGMFEVRTFNA